MMMKVHVPSILLLCISMFPGHCWLIIGGASASAFIISSPSVAPHSSSSTSVLLSLSDIEGGTSSPPSSSSSDLKSLLPTPKKRTLTLDKFGRRVHDLTDDGTAKYNRMDATSTPAMKAEEEEGREEIRKKNRRSDKDQAMIASSAFFRAATAAEAGARTNLKTLLPQGKSFSRGIKETAGSSSSAAPALSQMLDMLNDGSVVVKSEKARAADASSADFRIISKPGGSDLKALLPRQNTRFLKLDKFGRRIQKMQDDGTVNVTKELTSTTTYATTRSEIEWGNPTTTGNTNYGSLKNLAPTKRETWTRLDFKGGSIIDERRTATAIISKVSDVALSTTQGEGGSNLKALLPKRSTWTMLDFKGGQIEDFRRTRGADSSSSSGSIISLNDNKPYSNLKLLLPPRTITWRKKSQLLSSGSAPIMSSNVRGLREERLVDIKDEITSDTSLSDDEVNVVYDDDDDDDEEMDLTNKFTNLKDLLPEKRSTSRTVL